MIRRIAIPLAGAALAVVFAGPAVADPSGLEPNPNGQPNSSNANCVAKASTVWRHNGHAATLGQGGDPSGHDSGMSRGDEIKAIQENCP